MQIQRPMTTDRQLEATYAPNATARFDKVRSQSQASSMPERLKIDIEPKWLLAVSDHYVMFTPYGYRPALNVIDQKSKREYYIFIDPKSLSIPLEALRRENKNTLKGLEFWIRKKTNDKYSEYVVEE